MKLSDILKNRMKEMNLSADDIATACNVNRATVYRWLNGEVDNMKRSSIASLARILHLDPAVIVGNYEENEKSLPSFKNNNSVSIPLYGPICCGNGGFVDDNLIEMISLPADVLKPRRDYFAQRAKGDSMIGANIHDGDILVFEKSSTIENGQIGCFCLDDNEAVCKRYRVLAGGQICLMPENPDYSPILIDVTFQNFRCIGLLIVNIENMVGR